MKDYLKQLFSYRWHLGTVAWFLMRLTGLALALYLCLHLGVIFYFSKSSQTFAVFLAAKEHVFIKVLESLLVFAVCYHAGNGLRLILIDLGIGIPWQKHLFIGVLVLSLILSIIFLYPVWYG
jgi:succinate dehydrogenase / fumarate reductase cytochrome b subunit